MLTTTCESRSGFRKLWQACAFFCLLLPAGVARADVELTFGVYMADKPTTVVRQFRPVLDFLEVWLSRTLEETASIRLHVAKNYSQGMDHLVRGKVDFARFGPASYVLAKDRSPGISILAMESKRGKKVFHGVIAVRTDSDIASVENLVGRSFAFGDENSTIGRYLSQLFLMRQGILAADLSAYDYLGRHDVVGTAVALGSFDAGALKESTFRKLVADGVALRSIATFPNVTKPWIARDGLDREIAAALTKGLIALEDRAVLEALKKDGFVDGSDKDFDVIRAAIHDNPNFFARLNLGQAK